jgi:hypothetical protein
MGFGEASVAGGYRGLDGEDWMGRTGLEPLNGPRGFSGKVSSEQSLEGQNRT